jgi:hypothetical protein
MDKELIVTTIRREGEWVNGIESGSKRVWSQLSSAEKTGCGYVSAKNGLLRRFVPECGE